MQIHKIPMEEQKAIVKKYCAVRDELDSLETKKKELVKFGKGKIACLEEIRKYKS